MRLSPNQIAAIVLCMLSTQLSAERTLSSTLASGYVHQLAPVVRAWPVDDRLLAVEELVPGPVALERAAPLWDARGGVGHHVAHVVAGQPEHLEGDHLCRCGRPREAGADQLHGSPWSLPARELMGRAPLGARGSGAAAAHLVDGRESA